MTSSSLGPTCCYLRWKREVTGSDSSSAGDSVSDTFDTESDLKTQLGGTEVLFQVNREENKVVRPRAPALGAPRAH